MQNKKCHFDKQTNPSYTFDELYPEILWKARKNLVERWVDTQQTCLFLNWKKELLIFETKASPFLENLTLTVSEGSLTVIEAHFEGLFDFDHDIKFKPFKCLIILNIMIIFEGFFLACKKIYPGLEIRSETRMNNDKNLRLSQSLSFDEEYDEF